MVDPAVQNGDLMAGGGLPMPEPPLSIAQARVDDKGRLKLPAEFAGYLKDIGVNKVFVTTVDLELVRIYPTSLWNANEILAENAGELKEDVDDLVYLAKFYGGNSDIDPQGRVLIPAELRKELSLESQPVWIDCQRNGRMTVATKSVHEARIHRAKADLMEKKKRAERNGFK
jgi:MraZ protein